MPKYDELYFTEEEIRGFLPSGWNIPEGDEGEWDEEHNNWCVMVHDEVDFEYPLIVRLTDAQANGRLKALRAAVDQTYRGRLGKGTRGMGVT
jgi:hypothetical protein